MHGSPFGVEFMDLNTLDNKDIGNLYLLTCNSGHLDLTNNFATQLFNHSNIDMMVACDGTHFRYPDLGSIFGLGTKVKHTAEGNKLFRDYREMFNPGSKRKSTGFNKYTRDSAGTIQLVDTRN